MYAEQKQFLLCYNIFEELGNNRFSVCLCCGDTINAIFEFLNFFGLSDWFDLVGVD